MRKLKYRIFYILFCIKSIFVKRKEKKEEQDFIYPN